jgi:hypothetical protein
MPIAYGKRLKLRLFLEGVEVPVVSANVQAAPNSPIVASIQIPPLAEGTRFLPRTLVHLFFLDEYELRSPTFAERRSEGRRDPTAAQQVLEEEAEAQLSQYKLLFGGEMIGFTWNKTSGQRALILQCQDWSNYWDYAYQFNNTSIFGPGRKALFSGGATNLFTDFLKTKGNVITQIVSSGRCNAFPQLGGMAAGVIRLMEAIGGTYYPNPRARIKKRKLAGQNLFFSIAELRLHITHMVAAYEDDPTSMRLVRRQGWTRLFNRTIGGLGGQTSIRKAINALTRICFYETYGQPCPYYVPGADGSGTEQARVRIAETKEYAYLSKGANSLQKSAEACLNLLPTVFGESSSDVQTQQRAALGLAEDPGLPSGIASAEAKAELARRIHQLDNNLWQLITRSKAQRAPRRAQTLLSLGANSLSPLTPARIILPVVSNTLITKANRAKIESALKAFINAMSQITGVRAKGTTKAIPTPPRLNLHIFRPDIWFGAPPRCNVLFPEHYDYLTYQKMFLQEPTRFLLKTNDEFFGENFLFDKFYFSPQAPTVKSQKARMRQLMRGDVMDHELFTGILPVFEKMGEFNIFAGNRGLSPTQRKQYEKVGFAQRSANFLYFRHRYAARRMTVGGRFNPYVACGFPGLIVDKHVDRSTMQTYNSLLAVAGAPNQEISQSLGTNFLGNFTSVSHSVSQAESIGRTEITCTYSRQPEETVEFLGLEGGERVVRQKTGKTSRRVTDVAASSIPRVGSLGPNRGKIINVYEIDDVYTPGHELPLYGTGRGRKSTKVAVNAAVPTVVTPGMPPVDRYYKAYRLEEEIPRYQLKSVEIPTEELLRPGWYGDIWTPGRIGQAYNAFFGTGAISDPQTSYIGVPSEAMAQASEERETSEGTDDPKTEAPAVTALEEGATIQDAVDFLLLTYSYVRQNNLDVDSFASNYTWRPVATMADIFGTSNLKFTDDGAKVISGVEGIHSKAFGPYENLFGLVDPSIRNILGIKKDDVAAQKADTRKRKQDAVLQYAAAISFSRAILG